MTMIIKPQRFKLITHKYKISSYKIKTPSNKMEQSFEKYSTYICKII